MRLYKLTNSEGYSYNYTRWGEGITHTASGEGGLCGPGWLHAYTHPVLAVILNNIHANFILPLLWEAEGEIEKDDHGLKVGTTKLTTIRQLPLPEVTGTQAMRLAILSVLEVYKQPEVQEWGVRWLANTDRTLLSADNFRRGSYELEINESFFSLSKAAKLWCDWVANEYNTLPALHLRVAWTISYAADEALLDLIRLAELAMSES